MKKNLNDLDPKGRNQKMLKEMVKSNPRNNEKSLSPVEEALREFQQENGYEFMDMIKDPRVRDRHNFKQLQKKDYNDDDFFKKFEKHQGE